MYMMNWLSGLILGLLVALHFLQMHLYSITHKHLLNTLIRLELLTAHHFLRMKQQTL